MKHVGLLPLLFVLLLLSKSSIAQQSVGIGTNTPNPKAVLQLVSPGQNQGFLLPKLTTAQITALGLTLVDADKGLQVYDSLLQQIRYWDGTSWLTLNTATSSGTVTSVSTGTGLTGGPFTTSGIISLANTAVTPGTYGNGGSVGSFTVDATGRLTAATNVLIGISAAQITIGTLPIARGGTNGTDAPTAGAVAYGTGTAYAFTSAGISGQLLQSTGAGAPIWINPPATITASNGLTRTVNDIALGGTLSGATNINRAGFNLVVSGAGDFSVRPGGAGSERLFVNGTTGNVGIGTVTPLSPLQVGTKLGIFTDPNTPQEIISNNLYYDGTNFRYVTTNTGSALTLGNERAGLYTFPSGTAGSILSVSPSMRLNLTTLGLGIQVDNPQEVLHVNGPALLSQITTPGITTDRLYNVSGDLFWNGTNISSGSSGANLTLSNLTNPTAINQDLRFDNSADRLIGFPAGFSPLQGRSLTLSGEATSGAVLAGGNVNMSGGFSSTGVGGNAGITGGTSSTFAGGNVGISAGDGGAQGGSAFIRGGNSSGGTGGNIFISGGNGFSTIGNVYLASEFGLGLLGRVGIGLNGTTQTPTALLDITANTSARAALRLRNGVAPTTPNQGDIYADGNSVFYRNATSWVDLGGSSSGWSLSGNAGTTAADFIGTTDLQDFRIRTNNLERMTFAANGNIGIGATVPRSRLQIGNRMGLIAANLDDFTALTRNVYIDNADNPFYLNNGTANFLYMDDNSIELAIHPSGVANAALVSASRNLVVGLNGIGLNTSNPIYPAHLVAGAIGYGFVHDGGGVRVGTYVNAAGGWLGTQSNHDLRLFTNDNAGDMIIQASTGNVGIGTTAPPEPLSVIGQIGWGTPNAGTNRLQSDQGGSIDLGGNNFTANPVVGGAPYIDFHFGNGLVEDYNMRIINSANNSLFITDNTMASRFSISNGNVGIDIAAPAAKLDVNGAVRLEPITALVDPADDNRLYNVTGNLFWNGTNISGAGFSTLNSIPKGNGLGLVPSSITDNGSEVTISSAVGADMFRVVNTASSANINIQGTAAGGSLIRLSAGSQQTFVWSGSGNLFMDANAGTLHLQTSGTDRLFINNAGNIGIGTSSPATRLHVSSNGNVARLQGVDHAYIEYYADGPGSRTGFMGYASPSDNNFSIANDIGDLQLAPVTGRVGIGGGAFPPVTPLHVSSTSSTRVIMASGALTDIGLLLDNTSLGGRAYTLISSGTGSGLGLGNFNIVDDDAGLSRLSINSTGNVGISTTSPTERLDVNGNVKFSGALMPNNLSGTVGQVLTSAGPGLPPIWGSESGWGLTGNAGTNPGTNFIGTTDLQALSLRTNANERMRISEDGYVSVGGFGGLVNTFYAQRLPTNQWGSGYSSIYGLRNGSGVAVTEGGSAWSPSGVDAGVKGFSGWANYYTAGVAGFNYDNDFFGSTAAGRAGVIGGNQTGSIWGALMYYTGSATYGLYTPNNAHIGGSLGIGTTDPTDLLQVGSYLQNQNNYISVKTAGGNLYRAGIRLWHFTDDNGFTIESNEQANRLDIIRHASGTFNAMSIDRISGNVGIGTTSPLGKLHIANADYSVSPVHLSSTAGTAGATIRFTSPDAGARTYNLIGSTGSLANMGAGYFGIYDDNAIAYRFTIGPAGNTGIGVDVAQSRLHVQESIPAGGQYVGRFINTFTGSADGVALLAQTTNTSTNWGIGLEARGNYIGADIYGNNGGFTALRANAAGSSNAAIFNGNVQVFGALSKSSGTFKIDHPSDPANKYLVHSFVESPDMMNIYNGNITTDANGEAVVQLPDYFNVLNKDFRYQLTVIGTFAQAIVFEEIHEQANSFKVKTSEPQVKVSWQVTGVRKDPFANANRVVDVVEKPALEKGTYLHPELYGMPAHLRPGNKEKK